ncbi:MAG: CAP domain-containing protein [Sediminibacterium sp.]
MAKSLSLFFSLPLLVSFLLFACSPAIAQLSEVELPVKKIPHPAFRDTLVDKWNKSFPSYASLTAAEKESLYWVNLARRNPIFFCDSVLRPLLRIFPELQGPEARAMLKEVLETGTLPMYEPHRVLIKLARDHAQDLASKKAPLSHNSTNGTPFGTRMLRGGVNTCAAENLSLGSQGILLSVVLLYLDKGLVPAAHRQTLLSKQYTQIGVGASPFGSDQFILVQDFSCPLSFQ